jgi:hypothetical protein
LIDRRICRTNIYHVKSIKSIEWIWYGVNRFFQVKLNFRLLLLYRSCFCSYYADRRHVVVDGWYSKRNIIINTSDAVSKMQINGTSIIVYFTCSSFFEILQWIGWTKPLVDFTHPCQYQIRFVYHVGFDNSSVQDELFEFSIYVSNQFTEASLNVV